MENNKTEVEAEKINNEFTRDADSLIISEDSEKLKTPNELEGLGKKEELIASNDSGHDNKPKVRKTTVILAVVASAITLAMAAIVCIGFLNPIAPGSGEQQPDSGDENQVVRHNNYIGDNDNLEDDEKNIEDGDDTEKEESTGEEVAKKSTDYHSSNNFLFVGIDIPDELNELMSIMLWGARDGRSINVNRGIFYHDVMLLVDGTLPMNVNIVKTLKSSRVQPISLTDAQISTIMNNRGEDAGKESNKLLREHLEKNNGSVAFNGDDVARAYYSIFREEIEHQDSGGYCPPYYFDSELNVYYQMWPGCGGTTDYNRQYYFYGYDLSENGVNVYIAGGASLGDGKILCQIVSMEEMRNSRDSLDACDSTTAPNDFRIDESNYQNFAKYRFVFNKADDGTYYFVRVEKL